MHGGEEKNEGRDSGELVRMEKRKFAGDNVLGEVGGKFHRRLSLKNLLKKVLKKVLFWAS